MCTLSQIAKPLTGVFFLLLPLIALAMPPETGMYWNPNRPGWAIYVENQRNTIFVAVYAYASNDSEPEFYVASGPMFEGIENDFLPLIGDEPIHGFRQDLFRVPSGACLACPYTPYAPAQSIGRITLKFYGRGGLYAGIRFNDGTEFPYGGSSDGLSFRRFNFSLGGTNVEPGDAAPLFDDMRGEWVFTDQSDPMRPAWRFHFTTREDGLDLSDYDLVSSVGFRDTTRNAVMYCFVPNSRGLPQPQLGALPFAGCELRQSGESVFWTTAEYSIDEFVGSLGSIPPRSASTYRGPQRVIGRRISD